MAILNEAAKPQPRDQKKTTAPFATAGMATGIGGGVAAPAGVAPRAGATAGVGGGLVQASPPPSSTGGGGGGGGNSVLSQMAATGLTPADWAALAAGPQPQAAAAPMGAAPTNIDSTLTLDTAPTLPQDPAATGSDLMSDPNLIALLANYDSQLANQESDYRRQQEEADRSFQDSMPAFERNWDQNRSGIRNRFEGRGLLKSGETEDAVGRSYTQQGEDLSRQQTALADRKANLEQQLAQARIANQQARTAAILSYPGNVQVS